MRARLARHAVILSLVVAALAAGEAAQQVPGLAGVALR